MATLTSETHAKIVNTMNAYTYDYQSRANHMAELAAAENRPTDLDIEEYVISIAKVKGATKVLLTLESYSDRDYDLVYDLLLERFHAHVANIVNSERNHPTAILKPIIEAIEILVYSQNN